MARTAVFNVTLSKSYNKPVSVDYTTVAGTAVPPGDFTPTSGTLTFAAGQTSKQVQVTIRDDDPGLLESAFTVDLSNPVNCTIGVVNGNCVIPGLEDEDETPPVVIVGGPLIKRGLITNAFHDALGRGGYFHQFSGTSEGQSIGIEGSLLAYKTLTNGTAEEKAAADWYRNVGFTLLDAMGDGSSNSPMLRQPIPEDVNTITLLHWLFTSRGDVPIQAINYDFKATRQGNKLIIPASVPAGALGQAHKGAADAFRVWMVYPATSYLLYYSPYSPAFDEQNPTGDTSIRLDDGLAGPLATPSPHWKRVGNTIEVTLPSSAPADVTEWYVVYAYQNAGILPQGSAMEAYPNWTSLPDGYSACAPDTFRWFDYALNLAIENDNRPGKASNWTKLRDASRRTVVRGQNLSDLREVLKPLPQFDVIPLSGEPSGMFCYSNHPGAQPPSADKIAAGANSQWIGYNFWSRVGGSGGAVAPGAYVWNPDHMFYPAGWKGDIFNGAIQCTVPAPTSQADGVFQVQLGRGVNDEWRAKTSYQDGDQYLFVALTCSKKPDQAKNEKFYVFVSATKYFDLETRWYADIGQYEQFQAGNSSDGGPRYFLIPREDFKTLSGSVLPVGTRFENFGVSIEMGGAYTARIVAMRIVGGASTTWVQSNIAKAVKGAPMPFFPGAIPFATNADIPKQQFVGWNGSPFHGYQLPDLWYFLSGDAQAVHPNLTVNDLPVPAASGGAITYPISDKTSAGTTKPKHALLMEQQLLFLKHAQDKYAADGGTPGPFAHTFVLNTAARMTIGNPNPSTWVYINDDPNTRWCGYQCRVIDALSRLVYLTRSDAGFLAARDMAKAMVIKWLTAYNGFWPNLNGKSHTDAATGKTTMIYGAPTDYPDPRVSGPVTTYEEPHSPALVLRGCIWLKSSGLLSGSELALVNAVGKRCFDYIELRWNGDERSDMRYTWHNTAADNTAEYFGFWVFEIIATLSYMLLNPAGAPDGVDLARARYFITAHQIWLANHVE